MKNALIRIMAFLLALISICTFIIGSTFKGISTEFDFTGYDTFEEFYAGGTKESADSFLENNMSYLKHYGQTNSKENLVELISYDADNYLQGTQIKLTDEDGTVLFDNIKSDESEFMSSLTDTITITGYPVGTAIMFELQYLNEFDYLYSLNEIKNNFYLKENGQITYIEPISEYDEESDSIIYTVNGDSYKAGDIFTGKNGEVFELNKYGELIVTQTGSNSEVLIAELHLTDEVYLGYMFGQEAGILNLIEQIFLTREIIDGVIIVSAIVCAISMFILVSFIGNKKGTNEVSLNFIDRIPLEIIAFINALLSALIYTYGWLFYEYSYNLVLLSLGFIVLVQLLTFVTIVARLKAKTFIKNSFTYKFIKWALSPIRYFIGVIKYAFLEIPLVLKAVSVVLAFGILTLMFRYYNDALFFVLFLAAILFMITYIYLANLKSSIKKISEGDFDYKTDTKYMVLDFKEMAENLNKINEGLEEATQKKIKSERLKTELITNVSHDIKTPLTSIINYVDLIKKQNIQDDTVNEYIEVLDRQSQKLKRLIVDLVDASKINSGNVDAELENISISVVLEQIEGEYKEKLQKQNLELISSYPLENINVLLDSKHLNRIIDNLMGNILKYSLNGTRVYLEVKNYENTASIILKNTSKQMLNISADELMQRFVRGDESRNTEGNGLGLSIAESLMNVQGGKLEITVDGDLFKVEIIFNK